MKKEDLIYIKNALNWLLENKQEENPEHAFNIIYNSINKIDEAINFTDSSTELSDLFKFNTDVIYKNQNAKVLSFDKNTGLVDIVINSTEKPLYRINPNDLKLNEQLKTFNCINVIDGYEQCENQCLFCKTAKGF